jgi:hypothetical protein
MDETKKYTFTINTSDGHAIEWTAEMSDETYADFRTWIAENVGQGPSGALTISQSSGSIRVISTEHIVSVDILKPELEEAPEEA